MSRRARRIDPFLAAIVAAVTCAALAPGLGAPGGPLQVDRLTAVAVAGVFFLHGALLPLEALLNGIRQWRLHLVIQGTTFALFPAVGALCLLLPTLGMPPALAIGFFFTSTVSSTISSSVAMTATAAGDVAGALFNATVSGILGVFLTPAYLTLVAARSGIDLSLGAVIGTVALKILLPLVVGQLLRPLLRSALERWHHVVQWVDRASIVLIVYGAFCGSFAAGVWSRATLVPAALSVLLALALLGVISAVTLIVARMAGLSRAARITAYFCATQKSLANGLPTAQAVFAGSAALGLIVMPLLVYHQVQLAVGAMVARRLGGIKEGP